MRFGADFGPKFSKFSRPQNFAFEIARDRAKIHATWWCTASSRPLEVPNICCERQHAVPREISCDSERISDRNFRGRKILRSKSREVAPKSMPPGGAQLRHDPCRSPTSVATVSMLCRMRFGAIRSGFRTEIFENFRNFKIHRSKSREIAPKSMPPGGAQLPHDP